jgi:hypothetical protein
MLTHSQPESHVPASLFLSPDPLSPIGGELRKNLESCVASICDAKTIEAREMEINSLRRYLDHFQGIEDRHAGPHLPDMFIWNERYCKGLARKPFSLIKVLWDNFDRELPVHNVITAIWNRTPGKHALGSTVRETNRFFRKHQLPFYVELKMGYVRIRSIRPRFNPCCKKISACPKIARASWCKRK